MACRTDTGARQVSLQHISLSALPYPSFLTAASRGFAPNLSVEEFLGPMVPLCSFFPSLGVAGLEIVRMIWSFSLQNVRSTAACKNFLGLDPGNFVCVCVCVCVGNLSADVAPAAQIREETAVHAVHVVAAIGFCASSQLHIVRGVMCESTCSALEFDALYTD